MYWNGIKNSPAFQGSFNPVFPRRLKDVIVLQDGCVDEPVIIMTGSFEVIEISPKGDISTTSPDPELRRWAQYWSKKLHFTSALAAEEKLNKISAQVIDLGGDLLRAVGGWFK